MSNKRELLTLDQAQEAIDMYDYKTSKPIDFSRKKNRFEHDGDSFVLVANGKEKRIAPVGVSNLMHSLNIPTALPNKLKKHPDLVSDLINKVVERENSYLRTISRRNSVMSFVDSEQTLISNGEILEAAKSILKEPLFDQARTTEDGVASFNIVSEAGDKLRIGQHDKFLGGVRIENNPLRSSSTKIESYLERLVCLNGQISTRAFWSAPRRMEDEPRDWLETSITNARNESDGMFKSIAKLADKKIDANIEDFLESIYDSLKVPEKVRDLISRRVTKEGATTLYDLFNHITYVASNYKAVRENPDLSARLMRIGGHFAEHIEDACESCNRPAFSLV